MGHKSLRIVFAGTPEFAAKHLEKLVEVGHDIVGCYTQPDRPAGRGKKLQASAVKEVALANDIPVFQPASFKQEEAQQELATLNADLMIVVAYGLILPKVVLNTPTHGCINVHGSILPKWRGAAPIQRAVLTGDAETGVTIMQMDEGLDTGDMILIERCAIKSTDTSGSVYEKLQNVGPEALIKAVDMIGDNQATRTPQDNDLATYAHKLTKEEARINWQDSAEQIERNIRGFQPWPVATMTLAEQTIKVWQANLVPSSSNDANANTSNVAGEIISSDKNGIVINTGDGLIAITQLQPPGKKAMAVTDFLNGRADWVTPGTVLV
jgi:methionyl-tRNA formyltransferase